MDYQLLVAVLALGIAGYTAHLQHQQVKLMQAGQEDLPGLPGPPPWWKAPPVVAVFALALLTWAPWIVAAVKPKPFVIGAYGWGGINLTTGTLPIVAVMSATDPNIKLMAIAFHYNGTTDFTDVKQLQKSALYDVRQGTQIIMIQADSDFIEDVTSKKQIGTNFMLLTVPAKLENPEFSTLRQAFSMGVQIVWNGTGPP
jgi:hypothetical protein